MALLAVVGGVVLVTASLAGSFWPRVAGEPISQRWSGETLYLRADGPEGQRCTVSPPGGPARTVAVPGTPGRGLRLSGTRLEPWFDGEAAIDCPASVTATTCRQRRSYAQP